MKVGHALDALPAPSLTPREKLLQALAMYDEGVAMQRLALRRRFPEHSEPEVEAKLAAWLARADEAR